MSFEILDVFAELLDGFLHFFDEFFVFLVLLPVNIPFSFHLDEIALKIDDLFGFLQL